MAQRDWTKAHDEEYQKWKDKDPGAPSKEKLVNLARVYLRKAPGVNPLDVEKVLKGFEDEVNDVVSKGDEKLTLPGFLSFERTRRAARTGRNPQTGETIQVPASNAVKVTAGSKLKATAKNS